MPMLKMSGRGGAGGKRVKRGGMPNQAHAQESNDLKALHLATQ